MKSEQTNSKSLFLNFSIALSLFISIFIYTRFSNASSNKNPNDGYHFEFTDASSRPKWEFPSPIVIIDALLGRGEEQDPVNRIILDSFTQVDLLQWTQVSSSVENPVVDYNRKKHFGTWVNDPYDGRCHNTRALVLMRDSAEDVGMRPGSRCTVDSGIWPDPYTGRNIRMAADIQIDHLVPLKHTFMMGGWKWNRYKRCMYANFLGFDYHLLSVDGHENMRKGDRTPADYMPPSRKYQCEYVQHWLQVKMLWKLPLLVTEAVQIEKTIREEHCDLNDFIFRKSEMKNIRRDIVASQKICDTEARKLDDIIKE